MRRRVRQPAHFSPSSSPAADIESALVKALAHHNAGRLAEAEELYRSVVVSPPGHPLASYGLGLLRAAQGRLSEAVDAYRDTIAVRPDFVDAHINLGTALLALGQPESAMPFYQRAIALCPENAMAHGNLGKALQDVGRIDDSIAEYRMALALEPYNALLHANLGAALLDRQAWGDSATLTLRAIALKPDDAMAHANLGTALMHLGRHEEALAACRRAMELQPRGFAIHASLGGAMLELGALAEAAALCRHAITLDPARADAFFNLSHALKAMNQLEASELAARQTIALCPQAAEYHFHLAHILLLRGDLDAGWTEYDWRWRLTDFAWMGDIHGKFSQPLWTGEDIHDKTILVHTEQGLGDMILFARYLPLVVRRARRVVVAAHPLMCCLLETVEGVTVVSIRDVPLPDFDVHCPLLSLPRAFATRLNNIPTLVPYLHVDPMKRERWARRINRDRLRVGIVWAGNPATKRDYFRSPGLAGVAPIFSVPGVDFIALQVGGRPEERETGWLPSHVLDLGPEVGDFADTAAIMVGLDLMISSCTAPLHLAGALGVRTWAMIPFAPYFPWLLERTDTPWYPTMRLYRQTEHGRDWSEVIGRISIDLATLVRSVSRGSRSNSNVSREIESPNYFDRDTPSDRGREMTMAIVGQEANGCNELAHCRGGLMLYNRNDTYIGASLRKYGEFSGEEGALFRLIVQPGRTVLDIGANVGAHTVDLSRLAGAKGAVHAFEPQRLVYQLLCANLALNSCTNVFAHHAAVGAAIDTILVPWLDPDECHNYGGLSVADSPSGEFAPMITIDSLGLHDCQFIKLDVEGMETEALRGAAATIRRFRPILYVENDRPARSAELIALLITFGYRLYWHAPPLYRVENFRGDPENIFGGKVSVNMICIPAEIPQSSLTNLREVSGPTDSIVTW